MQLARWVIAGDSTLGVGHATVSVASRRGGYVLTARDDDGVETSEADDPDDLGAEWAVEQAEYDQRERIDSAARDACQSLLDTLLDSGRALDVLKALRTL